MQNHKVGLFFINGFMCKYNVFNDVSEYLSKTAKFNLYNDHYYEECNSSTSYLDYYISCVINALKVSRHLIIIAFSRGCLVTRQIVDNFTSSKFTVVLLSPHYQFTRFDSIKYRIALNNIPTTTSIKELQIASLGKDIFEKYESYMVEETVYWKEKVTSDLASLICQVDNYNNYQSYYNFSHTIISDKSLPDVTGKSMFILENGHHFLPLHSGQKVAQIIQSLEV